MPSRRSKTDSASSRRTRIGRQRAEPEPPVIEIEVARQEPVLTIQPPPIMAEDNQGGEPPRTGVPPIASFFLCPAAANTGIIDYSSKEGKKLYSEATAKLCEESLSCDSEEYHDLIQVVTQRAMEWSWDTGIMSIPTDADNPDSPRVSLIQEHGTLTIGQIRRYEKTYIATQSRQAQDTYMLYQALFKTLSKIGRSRVILERKNYMVLVNGREYHSGTLLMKVILTKMHLETKAAARMIRQRLASLDTYMTKIGYDVTKFNNYVKSQHQQLVVRGETTNDLLNNVLKAYEVVPGEDWKAWHGRVQERLDDGAILSVEGLLEKAEAKYKTLLDDGKWNVLSENEKQIIALKAQIQGMKKGKKTSGKEKKTRPARKPRVDKHAAIKNKIPANPKRPVVIDGRKWFWCGKATGGHCEKLTRHQPTNCIAGFGRMTPEERKSAIKKSERKTTKKELTFKETVMDDRSSEGGENSTEMDEESTATTESVRQEVRDLHLDGDSE